MGLTTVTFSGGGGASIYTADDSLTGNRVLTGAGFSLAFTGVSIFTVSSATGSLSVGGGPGDWSLSGGGTGSLSSSSLLSINSSGGNVVLQSAFNISAAGHVGHGTGPSGTYRFQVLTNNAFGNDYAIRGLHQKTTGNGAAVYGQVNGARTDAGQVIAVLAENTSVTTSGINVGMYATASGAAGALNNRAIVVPRLQGQVVLGRLAPLDGTVLVSIHGETSDATKYAMRIYRDNTVPMVTVRNDGWTGFGNIASPLSAGIQVETAGALRIRSGGLFLGNAGPTSNVVRAPSGWSILFGASRIQENGAVWEFRTGTGGYRFYNSSGGLILDMNRSSPNSRVTMYCRDSNGSVVINRTDLELRSTYWNGASSVEKFNTIQSNISDTTSGNTQLEFKINGVTKAYMQEAGSALRTAGDIEVGSADAYYWGDPDTNDSWRAMRSGDDLLFQQREGGTWNTKSTISGA